MLNVIFKQDRDVEMQCCFEFKIEYCVSDGQIICEFFKVFMVIEVVVVRKISDSVDLSKVEQFGYLKDGWIFSCDVSLVYGFFGIGKILLLFVLVFVVVKGELFLDWMIFGERLKMLVIVIDSGIGLLKKVLDDFGVDFDDFLFKLGYFD